MTRRTGTAASLGVALLLLLPAVALAHPLGNFTINHYTGIRVARDAVTLDVVIDEAEIPTFEVRQELDTNGDGDVSDAEAGAARIPRCTSLEASLALGVDGRAQPLTLTAAGIDFPAGAGGLPTLRLVCEYAVALGTPVSSRTAITYADRSFPERIGWREITVVGDRVSIVASGLPQASVSNRLTHYPTDLLQQPLAVPSASFAAVPGGPAAPAFVALDAWPIAPSSASASRPAGTETPALASVAAAPGVPGGIGAEIDGLLRTPDMTPLVLLGSILAAIALGAGHALTPGHGKTLMGAYLIGTRGTPVHAIGLGLAVAISHTVGIFALALVVLAAGAALPPEQFQRIAVTGSALVLTGIGGWLLVGQLRSLRHRRHDHADRHDHRHDHDHDTEHGAAHGHDHAHDAPPTLTWRSLFLLGLAGGLVPSTNALLILLATIATNRPAFGLVLVVAFGLGMAAVMAGVGLTLIFARDWLTSRLRLPAFGRLAALAPAGAAVFVFALGLVLTSEALGAVRL